MSATGQLLHGVSGQFVVSAVIIGDMLNPRPWGVP
jgi:hypothetical protein